MAKRKAADPRTKLKPEAVHARSHRKITLTLDAATDERLTLESRRKGYTRSQMVNEILDGMLKHIVISIRGREVTDDMTDEELMQLLTVTPG